MKRRSAAMKMQEFVCAIGAILLSSCASNDNPPCRRVSAEQFMRPHTFKGIPTDQFIGTTGEGAMSHGSGDKRAFKQVWELGLNHGWAVLWCPVEELPQSYLRTAHEKPFVERDNGRLSP